MNNDLISREALKKRIQLAPNKNDETWGELYDAIIYEIDNAPTVENITVFCENADEKTIEELKAELERVVKTELRPQGEWLYNDYGNGCGNWHCSICDHMPYYATKYMRFLNFCPNCGADLREEAEP